MLKLFSRKSKKSSKTDSPKEVKATPRLKKSTTVSSASSPPATLQPPPLPVIVTKASTPPPPPPPLPIDTSTQSINLSKSFNDKKSSFKISDFGKAPASSMGGRRNLSMLGLETTAPPKEYTVRSISQLSLTSLATKSALAHGYLLPKHPPQKGEQVLFSASDDCMPRSYASSTTNRSVLQIYDLATSDDSLIKTMRVVTWNEEDDLLLESGLALKDTLQSPDGQYMYRSKTMPPVWGIASDDDDEEEEEGEEVEENSLPSLEEDLSNQYVYHAPSERPVGGLSRDTSFMVNEKAPKHTSSLSIIEFGIRTRDLRRVTFKTIPNPELAKAELDALGCTVQKHCPHVIKCLHSFQDSQNRHVLVFPRLKQLPFVPMNLLDATVLLHDLLLALKAVHESGWVHLDINPSNLMQNEAEKLVLIDFGLARRIVPGTVLPRCGTAGYIAPEVYRGVATDPRADVWSAGIIYSEMVAHYLPEYQDRLSALGSRFNSTAGMQDVRDVFSEISYQSRLPRCLQHAAEVCLKMLEEDWRKRPTVEECLRLEIVAQCKSAVVEGDDYPWLELTPWLHSKKSRRRREENYW